MLATCVYGLFTATAVYAQSYQPCPILGPRFPIPSSLPSSSIVQSAIKKLTATFDDINGTGNSSEFGTTTPDTTTFSVALFSAANTMDNPFFYQYHYSAPSLRSGTAGVKVVDANSIYRVGGVTQVFTIMEVLIKSGEVHLGDPIVKFVPELAKAASDHSQAPYPIQRVDWGDVTVGDLTSHLAGITRGDDLDVLTYGADPLTYGALPASMAALLPLGSSDTPRCGRTSACSRSAFFKQLLTRPPVDLPGSTPIYSNAAFQILAFALEGIGNKSFASALDDDIIEPLGMTLTSLSPPQNTSNGVVPANETASGWASNFVRETALLGAEGVFSTITDLSKFGSAILSSSLITSAETRRWLKPVTDTSNLVNSVGRPWEIYSSTLDFKAINPVVDIYAKVGNTGLYASYIGLVPDYNVGFAILAADSVSSPDLNVHADVISEVFLPALEVVAKAEAAENLAGNYSTGVNSSITIMVDDQAGLSVTSWYDDDKNVRAAYAEANGIDPKNLDFRLYPTSLQSPRRCGYTSVFTAVFQDVTALADAGTPTCITWMGVDILSYKGVGLDEFAFDLSENGTAVRVTALALNITLARVQ